MRPEAQCVETVGSTAEGKPKLSRCLVRGHDDWHRTADGMYWLVDGGEWYVLQTGNAQVTKGDA